MLHQVGDLFELNAKLRCQKVKVTILQHTSSHMFRPSLADHQAAHKCIKQLYNRVFPDDRPVSS